MFKNSTNLRYALYNYNTFIYIYNRKKNVNSRTNIYRYQKVLLNLGNFLILNLILLVQLDKPPPRETKYKLYFIAL